MMNFLTVKTYRQAKRLVRIVVGFTLLIIGALLIVLPGPAFVVIPLGLVVLAGEFAWARRLLNRFNDGINSGYRGLRRFF
ncbi:MAG: PGPGW domain-containing protein [Nitrospirota bacterium]